MYTLMAEVEGGYIYVGCYPTEIGARRVANRLVNYREYRRVEVYAPRKYLHLDEPLYVRERD